MEPTAYKHPKFPNVIFWDFPDIETTNLQPREYLEKVTFCEYDFFMIVSATHFKESDVQLAKAIQQMKKNFYFIRYKVDIDMQNEQRCNPTNFDRGKVLQQIQDNCLYPLKQIVMDELQIFLVSGDDLSEYDFPILVETLLKDLSTQKRHILVLSLPSVTEEDIERKKNSLKQMIWLKAVKDDLSTLHKQQT
ncbi:interferon-inducible GTPase 1-like [Rhynchocyon petersi]